MLKSDKIIEFGLDEIHRLITDFDTTSYRLNFVTRAGKFGYFDTSTNNIILSQQPLPCKR